MNELFFKTINKKLQKTFNSFFKKKNYLHTLQTYITNLFDCRCHINTKGA